MIIKKLELHGFKSFSDRTRLLFHPGITAIIGPNGTGKSNIVDALLWTLRGRRLRAQRGDRTGENIFNGNAKQPPMSMADVAVVLGEEKEADKEDLILNHRLFRSGENEYRMNGKVARLRDIQEALHLHAIGDTDYFVIEQGSVGNFVTSKPMEKRLLLEEAAGTAFYKDKKRQAQNKLDSSEQNLLRLEDIILEVEKATNSLKRQAQSAIRYRKLREHIRELTLSVYRQKIEGLETGQRDASSGYQMRLESENVIIRKIKEEEKNLAEQRKQVWELERKLQEDKDSLYALKAQLSRAEAEKEREEKREDYFVEKKAAAEAGLAELAKEREELERESREVRAQVEDLTARLQEKKKALAGADKAQAGSLREMSDLEKRIEEYREEYLRSLSSQTEVNNDAARYEKELELTTIQGTKLNKELEEQRRIRKEKAARLKEKESALAQLEARAVQTMERLEEREGQRDAARHRLEQLEGRRDSLQAELDKKSHHLHALERLKEQESRADDVPALPEALGQLADLIDTTEEHTSLIDVFYKDEASAALVKTGDLLGNLQRTDGTPLKGRFLLLHPQGEAGSPPSSMIDDTRVRGWLKAHIRADTGIDTPLSTLGDAAIVGSVQDAVDLWVQHPRFSFITLGGDLLLSSGLLKLGERKDGLISLNRDIKGLKEETSRLQRDLSPLASEIEGAARERDALEQQVRDEAASLASLRQQEGVERKEVSFALSAVEQARAHIGVLEDESRKVTDDKQEVTRHWKSLTTRISDLKTEGAELNEKIRSEEQALIELRQSSEQVRRTFFQLRSEKDLLVEKIDNARDLIKRLDQRNAFVERKSGDLAREIESAVEGKRSLRERMHELDTQAGRLEKETGENASLLAEEESRLAALQKGLEETEERIREIREGFETAKDDRVKWEVSKAERERDLINLEETCWQEVKKTLQEIKAEVPLEDIDIAESEAALEQARDKLQRFKAVNLMAEEEYLSQKKRLDFLSQQRADLAESISSTKEAIKKIDHESKTQFLRALIAVNQNFQDVFAQLFEGGTAQVKLTDEDDPLESGVEIVAQPPGKRVQSLNLLSGGEKTLTSLAFFFALFRYKPAPFCILDEVDAALDDTNLARFLNLMRNIKDQTQFIIITHNYKTMEVADYIYGTTMAEPNITSIYSVKIKDKGRNALPESADEGPQSTDN